MREFWDNRFAADEYVYGTEPNAFFRGYLQDRKPGRLLLPAEGEGRNAVYAALRGWQVDAFDFSPVAQEKALKLAAERQVVIDYRIYDVAGFDTEGKCYDLIALLYVHLDPPARRTFHRKVADMLSENGTVILEAFSKEQLGNSSGGPQKPDMLYSTEELRSDFEGLTFRLLCREEIVLQEGKGHAGTASVVRMVARTGA